MNEAKRIGVAIVGTGAIAEIQADGYLAFADCCEIVAVCDIFAEKAQVFAAKKAPSARVYTEFNEMICDATVDMVAICLPPALHADATIRALRSGKHVLVEKPMAPSLAECDAMIAAAHESGKLLSVVCQNRFKTPMRKVKTLLEQGVIGTLRQTIVNSYWWRGENYYDLWWRGTWEKEGGGCLMSQAVHHLDLMQWMIGMPKQVTAVMTNVAHPNSECEDIAMAILEYPGMLAQVSTSLVMHGEEQEIIFQGSRGGMSIPWQVTAQQTTENGFPQENRAAAEEIDAAYRALPALTHESHEAQIKNFLDAILGKEALCIDGAEGRKTIELMMAIYKACATRTTVSLPLSPDDDFYHKERMNAAMPHFFEKTRSIDNFSTTKITLPRDVGQ